MPVDAVPNADGTSQIICVPILSNLPEEAVLSAVYSPTDVLSRFLRQPELPQDQEPYHDP